MNAKETFLYLADRFSGFKTMSFLNELKNTSSLTKEEVKRLQWQRLKQVLEFAYRNSEFYKVRFRKAGLTPQDIKSVEDFKKFPLLTKQEMREHKAGIVSGNQDIFIQSGGTTDNYPGQTHLTYSCASKKYALYLRHLLRCGWDFQTKIIHFLPLMYKKRVIHYEYGLKQFLSTVIQHKIAHDFLTGRELVFYDDLNPVISEFDLKKYAGKINSNRKLILIGRADFLSLLIHNFNKAGIEVEGPQSIINIGVLLPPALARRIGSFFKTEVYNVYGSSELSYIAGSCPGSPDLCINEEAHYLEAIDWQEAKGHWRKLVVTDLFNYSMPIIRYELADLCRINDSNGPFRLLDVGGRLARCVPNNRGRLLSEKEISEEIFNDENILQFCLKASSNTLEVVSADKNANTDRFRQSLKNLGLEGVKVTFLKQLDPLPVNKLSYTG